MSFRSVSKQLSAAFSGLSTSTRVSKQLTLGRWCSTEPRFFSAGMSPCKLTGKHPAHPAVPKSWKARGSFPSCYVHSVPLGGGSAFSSSTCSHHSELSVTSHSRCQAHLLITSTCVYFGLQAPVCRSRVSYFTLTPLISALPCQASYFPEAHGNVQNDTPQPVPELGPYSVQRIHHFNSALQR